MKLSNQIYEGRYFKGKEWKDNNNVFNEKILNIEYFHFYEYLSGDEIKSDEKINFPNSTFIVSIESTEITFIENFNQNSYSQTLLKIPFGYHHDSIQEYNQRVIDFINNKYGFLLKGFLQDLFIYNYFEDTGRIAEIKDLVLGIPILNGLSYKYGFEGIYDEVAAKGELCICNLCTKTENDLVVNSIQKDDAEINVKGGSFINNFSNSFNTASIRFSNFLWFWIVNIMSRIPSRYIQNAILRGQKNITLKCIYKNDEKLNIRVKSMLSFYQNYVRFITEPKNEKFFSASTNKFPFKSTDGELLEAQKKISEIKNKNISVQKIDSVICQYFIGRYGLFEGIGKKPLLSIISVFAVVLTIICILLETISFNLNSQWSISEVLLPLMLLICVFVFPVLFIIFSKAFPHIILPRLVVAIFSGWLIFLSAEEIMKIDYGLEGVNLFLICGAFVVFLIIFLLNEIKNSATSLSKRLIRARTAQIFSVSLIISYSIGFFVMSYVNNKFLGLDSFIVNNSRMQKGQTLKLDLLKNEEKFLDLVNSSRNDIKKLASETKRKIDLEILISKNKLKELGYETSKQGSYLKAIDHFSSNLISKRSYSINDTLKGIILSDTSSYKVIPQYILNKCLNTKESRDSVIASLDSIMSKDIKLSNKVKDKINFEKIIDKEKFTEYDKLVLRNNLKKIKTFLKDKSDLDQIFNERISLMSLFDLRRNLNEIRQQYVKDSSFVNQLYDVNKDTSILDNIGYNESILKNKLSRLLTHLDDLNNSNLFTDKISNLDAITGIIFSIEKIADQLKNTRNEIFIEENNLRKTASEDKFANAPDGEVVIKSDKLRFSKVYKIFNLEHKVYPNMIIFRSLIALFIGIFLQLIVQEKTITAPL